MVYKFVINLDKRTDRWNKYDDHGYTRWSATSINDIDSSDPIIDKMISYHNIRHTDQHLAKIGCWLSHTRLLKHIIDNQLNEVLIIEDDALGVWNEDTSYLLNDCITYMGGFLVNPTITEKLDRDKLDIYYGLNLVDDTEFKIMTTLAYYIPTWELAKELYEQVINQSRYRAIDVMYSHTTIPKAFIYPAVFQEQRIDSDIRKSKKKFANVYYEFA